MKLFSSVGDFFALDIGTTSVRVAELHSSGSSWTLGKYGMTPVDIRVATSDAPEDQRRLGDVINSLISQTGITSKNVVVGIPSSKTFITVVELPEMSQQELASTIKYQAEQYIPMPIDEVKVDWAVIGKSPLDANKQEVLLASVPNKFSEARLELIEGLGLNVIAIEPDSIALVRSLIRPEEKGAHLIIDFGDFSTDIVVVLDGAPRLVRSIPMGMQTLIKAAVQNLNVDMNQAHQFILKFGLLQDRLEGQILQALQLTMEQFTAEVGKSVKFFQTRYPNAQIQSAIMAGYAASIPGFDQFTSSHTTLKTRQGDPWCNVRHSSSANDTLHQIAPQFSVVVGLAERHV